MTDFDRDRKLFLSHFPGIKTFQTFPDQKEGLEKDQLKYLTRQVSVHEDQYPVDGNIDFEKPYMDIATIFGLEYLNEKGAGVFVTINETNGKGRKTTDITKVRAVFADMDGEPLPGTFEEPPSMLVESSPGKFHIYWVVEDFPKQSFKPIQEAIAEKFNADRRVKDLPRVMRLPGFYHQKGEPFMTRVLEATNAVYTYGQIVDMFPPLPRKQWSAPKYTTPVQYTGEFKGQYGCGDGGRNNHLTRRIGGMIARRLSWQEIEQEAYREAQACSPPVSESETNLVLKSMRRYL